MLTHTMKNLLWEEECVQKTSGKEVQVISEEND